MPDWKKIKAEYIRGGVSLKALADKYGVSFSTIQKRSMTENWTDLKKKSGRIFDERIADSAARHEAKKVDQIDTIADMLLQKIEEVMGRDEIVSSPSNMRQLSMTLKDIREIKGYKTELDRQEQMARIEKLRREAQGEETDKEIKVVFASDMSDYSN